MTHTSPRRLRLLLLSVAVAMAACSEQSEVTPVDISGANSMQAIDLDSPYGGLEFNDESAGFADAQLVAETQREDDDLLTGVDADLFAGEDRPELERIWVTIQWGRLEGRPLGDPSRDEELFERVDWSGTVSVDTGLVILKRTLLFEFPRDHRLPRSSRRSVGWVSHTGPHKDGILVCIGLPPASRKLTPGSMTFATGPLTQHFSFDELRAGLDVVIDTAIEGNAVSIVASSERPQLCPAGFLGGYWQFQPRDEHGGGWFRGRVVSERGRHVGYLAGRFGIEKDGEQVFAGKLIGLDGQIRGLVQGHYELQGEGDGSFQGRWVNREGATLGVLKGRFRSRADGAGHFQGVWERLCRD